MDKGVYKFQNKKLQSLKMTNNNSYYPSIISLCSFFFFVVTILVIQALSCLHNFVSQNYL